MTGIWKKLFLFCLHSALFVSNELIINREKRVDTFTFYIHCRLHLMPAAVIFYAIGRAFVGHREDRFSIAPTIFSLSLWRRTLPAHRLLHLHMYDSVDSANKSAMCRWQCIHKPGLYTLHNHLNINRIQTKVQSADKITYTPPDLYALHT